MAVQSHSMRTLDWLNIFQKVIIIICSPQFVQIVVFIFRQEPIEMHINRIVHATASNATSVKNHSNE